MFKTIPLRDKNFMQRLTESNTNQNSGHDPEAVAYEPCNKDWISITRGHAVE
jgi:hypothetical protein